MKNYTLPEGKVLVLRSCKPDMTSKDGFKWPEQGFIEALDWIDNTDCGHGLHGWLWAVGDYGHASAAGNYGHAIVLGTKGKARCGDNGAVILTYWDDNASRRRHVVGYAGENGIEAGKWYQLNANNEFEETTIDEVNS
jgi:hypothetical protein